MPARITWELVATTVDRDALDGWRKDIRDYRETGSSWLDIERLFACAVANCVVALREPPTEFVWLYRALHRLADTQIKAELDQFVEYWPATEYQTPQRSAQ